MFLSKFSYSQIIKIDNHGKCIISELIIIYLNHYRATFFNMYVYVSVYVDANLKNLYFQTKDASCGREEPEPSLFSSLH
jgi:hypothetical protein